jgi:hypothetical protein
MINTKKKFFKKKRKKEKRKPLSVRWSFCLTQILLATFKILKQTNNLFFGRLSFQRDTTTTAANVLIPNAPISTNTSGCCEPPKTAWIQSQEYKTGRTQERERARERERRVASAEVRKGFCEFYVRGRTCEMQQGGALATSGHPGIKSRTSGYHPGYVDINAV